MKHRPTRSAGSSGSRGRPLLTSLLVAAALLLAPAVAGANQVFKQCRKDWVKQSKKLSPEQLGWRLQEASAELQKDLDGDGLIDTLVLTNWPSYRNCDLKKTWQQKEVTLRIEYGHGKTRIFEWIGDQLVEQLKVYATQGRILVVAVDHQGQQNNRWVRYRDAVEAPPATLVAELGEGEEADAVQLASMR